MSLIGKTAPDFTLFNHKKEQVTLSASRGKKVVHAFYPAAFTGVCEKELCTLAGQFAGLAGASAQVYGISVDMPFSNAAFAVKTQAGFPLLSDVHREATRAYGVSWPNFAGIAGLEVSNRSVFVVDEKGTVIYEWIAPNPGVEPDYAAVQAALG